MRPFSMKMIVFCGITFILSGLLVVPYLALPAVDECVPDRNGYLSGAEAEFARGHLACAHSTYVKLEDARAYGISR